MTFENAIKKLILIYENKNKYVDYNFSSSKAIAYYVNTHDINHLISNEDMKEIYKSYKGYLKRKQIIIKELEVLSDTDIENCYIENNINEQIDYSSNYNTNSSESSNEVIEDYDIEEKNNHTSSSESSGNNKSNKKIIVQQRIIIQKLKIS